MHGNVWEWLQDCQHDNYNGAPVDGSAWEADKCQQRVLRGGSFDFWAGRLRSADRDRNLPGSRDRDYGFRCARGPN